MNNIEKRLAEEINSMPTSDFEKIKEAFNKIQSCNLQDTKTDKYTTQKKTVPLYIKASCVAAAFAIVFALWGYLNLIPYSYVEINTNQSIELSLNRLDKVMSVRSVNGDADSITANFKPSGNLDETIDDLLQLLDENDYIDNNDTIFVTVQCNKNDKRQQIMLLVNQKIESYLNSHNKNINIISENINVDDTPKSGAKKKDVSSVKLVIENNKAKVGSENVTPDNTIKTNDHDDTTMPSQNKNDVQNYSKAALPVKESKADITTAYISSAKNNNNIKSAKEGAAEDKTTKNSQANTNFNLQNEKPVAETPEIVSENNTNNNSVNITVGEPTAKDSTKSEKKAETIDGTEKKIIQP